MTTLCLILGDQLSRRLSSLRRVDKAGDTILFCEVLEEATYVKHHPKKIAFLFAAMRHFAAELASAGFRVRYIRLDDPANTGSFDGEVGRALQAVQASELIVTEPGEWRVLEKFQRWQKEFGHPVRIVEDDRFLASRDDFEKWVGDRTQLRMEFFYRDMRRRYRLLLDAEGEPTGGKWNYDHDNRKPPATGLTIPPRPVHEPDAITKEVLALVASRFADHFGDLEPFGFAVTAAGAQQEAEFFIEHLLAGFGDYQDAMLAGEPYLWHSRLSVYLNAGLLLPLDLCRQAEAAFHAGKAPLNAVEGFIRQILGWREFIRGIYWHYMPDYAQKNALAATQPVPALYWGAPTGMFCLAEAVRHTKEHAYSHHIQRLMITGNFALLAGLSPAEICAWYLEVYADAYEWVELPNTLGMALYGDGGIIGSKPYAASGNYINRMSNYCQHCSYDYKLTIGENACPFNALYWDFLARHEKKFRANQRMTYTYAAWAKMAADKQQGIREQARAVLIRMNEGDL